MMEEYTPHFAEAKQSEPYKQKIQIDPLMMYIHTHTFAGTHCKVTLLHVIFHQSIFCWSLMQQQTKEALTQKFLF